MSRKLGRIMRMEFRLTTANKAFIVLTILGPFLIVAVTVLPTPAHHEPEGPRQPRGQGRGGERRPRVPRGASSRPWPRRASGPSPSRATRPSWTPGSSRRSSTATSSCPTTSPRPRASSTCRRTSATSGRRARSRASSASRSWPCASRSAGLPVEQVASIIQPPAVETRKLQRSGEKESQDFLTILFTGLTLVMLLYMTVLLYGQTIGRSVLNEKLSKTVEIMLSSVSPMDLLFGKVLGKGLASLVQYGVWIGGEPRVHAVRRAPARRGPEARDHPGDPRVAGGSSSCSPSSSTARSTPAWEPPRRTSSTSASSPGR